MDDGRIIRELQERHVAHYAMDNVPRNLPYAKYFDALLSQVRGLPFSLFFFLPSPLSLSFPLCLECLNREICFP